MRKSKLMKVCVLSGLMLFALSTTSYAASWKQEEDGAWRFVRNDGGYATESWAQSGSDWYYMNGDGFITTDSLIDGGNNRTYYVKSDGVMAKNEWIRFENEETPAEPIWYYFGEDGSAYKGKSNNKVRPRVIDGKSYAFDAEGRMLRGYVTESGDLVEDSGSNLEFVEAMYYFGEDGAMYQNQWLQYIDTGRPGIYSQLAQRNYNEFDELWIYFGEKGKKTVAPNLSKVKTIVVNGITYSFDENGIMIPRLFATNSTIPATYSNATIRYGHVDASGDNKGDYWTFMVPNEEMSEEDYHMQEFSWFRTKPDGKVIKDRIATVLGRKYAFDEIGRMQTAFVIMNNDGTFAQQFDIDAFSTYDFKNDTIANMLPVLTRGNMYLFGTDELNDGSMRVNGEYNIVLNDGPAVIGVGYNGVVYGNKNRLQKVKNKYFINGLLINASSDLNYGVIVDQRDPARVKRHVVDSQGKVVTGKKKVVQALDGSYLLIVNDQFVARVDDAEKPKWATKHGQTGFWRMDSTLRGDARYVELITAATHGSVVDDDLLLYVAN